MFRRVSVMSAVALSMLAGAAAPAASAGLTGSTITCTMKYSGTTTSGKFYSLDETQRWRLGAITSQIPPRTTYAVVWRDEGVLVEPAGRWSVGPTTANIDIVAVQRLDGSWFLDRNVSSGFSPPGVVWKGAVPRPHPTEFKAIEFDFLAINVPANQPLPYRASQRQGTTPPSYYQFLKATPGRSVCSWNLKMT